MRAAIVVLAAGAGTRVGAEVNKVLLPLAGVPVVARSVRTASEVPGVVRVVLVVRDGEQDAVRAAVEPDLDPRPVEDAMGTGGETRHILERAARRLASAALYEAVLSTAERVGGAIPVARLDDLVAADGSDLPAVLVGVQTPQAFRAGDLLAAHRAAAAAGFEATDTAGILAAYADLTVAAVDSTERNLKLTVADDVAAAEALISG